MPNYDIKTQKGVFTISTAQDLTEDQVKSFITKQGGIKWLESKSQPAAVLPPAPVAPPPKIETGEQGVQRTVAEPQLITRPLTEPPKQDLSIGPTAQQTAQALTTPIRGFKGLGVGISKAIKREPEALQRAAEATKPGFEPETTPEKVGAIAGEVVGATPLFVLAGQLAAPLGTIAASGVSLAGVSAVEQLAETGKVDPTETAISGIIGAALPIAGKAAAKLTNEGLKQIARTTVSPEAGFLRNVMELEASKAVATSVPKVVAAEAIGKAGKEVIPEALSTDTMKAALDAGRGDKKAQLTILQKLHKKITGYDASKPNAVKAKELMNTRSGEEAEGLFDSQLFIHNMRKELTPVEDQALTFLIQKKLPTTFKLPDEVLALAKNPTPAMRKWETAITKHFEEAHPILSGIQDEVGYVKNYVPQIWETPPSASPASLQGIFFKTKNPFANTRSIPSFAEGLDAGFTPKSTRISDLVGIYDTNLVKTSANVKFIDSVKKMTDETGEALIQTTGKAPMDWVTFSHPSLRSAFPVKVHPEIAPHLKVVLDQPFSGKAIRSVETIKGIQKQAQLALSFFHPVALEESLTALVGVKKAVKINAKILRAMTKGELPIFSDVGLTKDALKHNLKLGAMPEFFIAQVRNSFEQAAKLTEKVPIIGGVTKAASRFQDIWNKGLWDYTHTGFKLMAYEDALAQNLKLMKGVPINKVKDHTAQLINDAFGGQNWQELMVHPKMRQALNWIFMAPDWNISAARQFGQAFKKGPAGKLGRNLWMRASFYMFALGNMVNFANTKRHTGTGRFMWDNDPQNKTKIFWKKDESGKNVYLRHGKQFREVVEFFSEFPQIFFRKSSPLVRTVVEQGTGTTTSGFELPFRGEGLLESPIERGKHLAKTLAPFSIAGKNIAFAFPRSVGMTPFRSIKMFEEAIEKGDKKKIKEISKATADNKLNPRTYFSIAKRNVTSRKKKKAIKKRQKRRKR